MIKQTKAYRSALAALADAIAAQDPSDVLLFGPDVDADLHDLLEHRHPKFYAAMDAAYDEAVRRRKKQERQAARVKHKAVTA